MTRFENILTAYRVGGLPLKWAELEIACEITPENVDAIMAKLPPEMLDDFSRWNFEEPGLFVGSNLTRAEEERRYAQLAVALPALRDWLGRQNRTSHEQNLSVQDSQAVAKD